MTAGPIEKRAFIRVPFNTSLEVRVEDRVIRSREGINISMGGACLATREAILPVGAPCRVTINLGGLENPVRIEVKGTTVRSRGGEPGGEIH